MKDIHDARSKHNLQKSKHIVNVKGAGLFGGVVRASVGVLGVKCLGSKEHLDWCKIDLNVAEIITVQDYKWTKN